mgnify:CR=1 FL=1
MKKKIWYDKEEDVLDIELNKGEYWKSVELENGVVIDVSKEGSILGIEILKASKVFSGDVKRVIENAQLAVAWVNTPYFFLPFPTNQAGFKNFFSLSKVESPSL